MFLSRDNLTKPHSREILHGNKNCIKTKKKFEIVYKTF